MQETNSKKCERLFTLWRIIDTAVILGFFVFTMLIGGSALLGHQDNGHFFVRDHADVVEVSALIWKISYVWGIVFLIFILLIPVVEVVIAKLKKKING